MRIQENFPLSEYLWYKIGGRTKYFCEVSSLDDIDPLLEFLVHKAPAKMFICGLGANLIFTDEAYDGAVISFHAPLEKKPLAHSENTLTVFAGAILDTTLQFASDSNLVGLEWAGGLPGTVGAGVRGNVGAFGGEIKDTLLAAEVMSLAHPDEGRKVLTNQELHFSYRHSLIKEQRELVVLSATFALTKTDQAGIASAKETSEKNREYRRKNHPLDYPNCGSVFKNIKQPEQVQAVVETWPETRELVEGKWHGKVSMGYIIRKLGLSGYTVGKAQISEKHCNFIINLGGATAVDVRTIIEEVQNRCDELFSFCPEVEVEIVQ